MVLIEAKHLSKYYGRFSAIQNISFSAKAGTITAFLGPNGAGKSTTIKIITGFLAPSSGTACIAGHDMSQDRLAGSQELGYVSEFAALYPDMHVSSYLQYIAALRHIPKSEQTAALDSVCQQCHLQEVWKKSIRKLSKGFRQRVALAQAIIHKPKVLILDEPSAGLDPNQIQIMRSFIKEFVAEDRTVLLSTHILQEVEALADNVLVIHQGQLQFDGPLSDLRADGLEQRFRHITNGEAI